MPGRDLSIMVHRLNINDNLRLILQNKRNFSFEKNVAIKEEMDKLLGVDFIEPCYLEQLANIVIVKKPMVHDLCVSTSRI